jgi:DNA-binding transcriptional LysR family regulator
MPWRHRVELRTLRYILAIADFGSVNAAAQTLHITQPSLSRQLRAFEKEMGVALFDRRNGRLVMNAAGRQFLPLARDLVRGADLAEKAIASMRDGRMQSVTINSPGTTLTDVIAPFLATWTDEDPIPEVRAEAPSEIYASLGRGADLAIGTAPPPPELAGHRLAVLPVWAYVRPQHHLSEHRHVRVEQLVEEHLLLLNGGQHARQSFDRALDEAGVALGRATEFTTPEVAQAVAAAGRGVAVVSDDPRFGLVPIGITTATRRVVVRLYAGWAPDHHAAATLESLARRLAEFCRDRYGLPAEHVAPGDGTGG